MTSIRTMWFDTATTPTPTPPASSPARDHGCYSPHDLRGIGLVVEIVVVVAQVARFYG